MTLVIAGAVSILSVIILSGLKASDMYSPDSSVHEVERIIISTLKNNENVMFPVFPSGRW